MSLEADQRDDLNLHDDLGDMIQHSLESRVGRAVPPARGREMLLAAAREVQVDHNQHRSSLREEYRWRPPQHSDEDHADHDAVSGMIHARESVRRMTL